MKRFLFATLLAFAIPTAATACPRYLGCGCHLSELVFHADRRPLHLAKAWLSVGAHVQRGCIGCIAVLSRGRGGHVGVVRGYAGHNPIIYSWGNRRIGWHTAVYPARRVIGYRSI